MPFITGVINNNGRQALFASEEHSYIFCFMKGTVSDIAFSDPFFRFYGENGFIYGSTNQGRKIAIYIGDYPCNVQESQGFNTAAYVVSRGMTEDTDEIKTFDAISFHGGTLGKVYTAKGIELVLPSEKSEYIAKYKDDNISYTFLTDIGQMKIEVSSVVRRNVSPPLSIDNSEVVLTLSFPSPQPLHTVINHYQIICKILAFLTYRRNVVFDRIELHKYSKEFAMLIPSADVLIKTDATLTNKDSFRCISIEKLGASFSELMRLFYAQHYAIERHLEREATEKLLPSLGFVPENDADISLMTNAKLREICSAVEFEIGNNKDINAQKNAIIAELVFEVKKCINEFKKRNPGLSNDEYSTLSGSLSHWSLPLREEIYAICEKYRTYIVNMAFSRYGINEYSLTRDDIKAFTTYRNNITHSSGTAMNITVVRTAFLLSGVVYCSILKRIGVSEDHINEFCANGMII